ncbi:MAG: NAD(P)/FAD-dependent oxidoreductase [Pseudomonadota bacterium]
MTKLPDQTDTVVVGAGQAGIAVSEHLGAAGVPHVVLERGRIAESWRSRRWDSLVANGPAWHDRFPNKTFASCDPDAFPGKESVADYLADYADQVSAPVHCGVDVHRVTRNDAERGFRVETSQGVINATRIVAATGPFQRPVVPPLVPDAAGLTQLHSADYRNPEQLPPGAVVVVGAGASGSQIAEELLASGRRVFLCIGPHQRPPRAYRGRDYCWWLGVLGKWEVVTPDPKTAHVTIAVSGANGGRTVDFRRFANDGMTLLGRAVGFEDGKLHLADDLAYNIAEGDAYLLATLDEADRYAERNGLDLPPDPEARQLGADPECVRNPIRTLDIAGENVSAIVWATGYALDFSWLEVDTFNDDGKPDHRRGIAREPGIYFLGLPWLSRRGSSFLWGVWHDARFIADQIVIQRNYEAYEHPSQIAS